MANAEIDNSSIQKALSEEAAKFTHVTKQDTPVLYEFVNKQAKRLGIDIEKERLDIIIGKQFGISIDQRDDGDFVHDGTYKKIDIGSNFVSGTVIHKDYSIKLLEGVVSHELKHLLDSKSTNEKEHNSIWPRLKNLIVHGDANYKEKIGECRADFVSSDSEGMIEYFSKKSIQRGDVGGSSHPNPTFRIKSLMIQSYIKEKTGIVLTADDVDFNNRCEFTITNKEKSAAIPSNVLRDANELADKDIKLIREVASYQEELRKKSHESAGEIAPTSVPLKPKQIHAKTERNTGIS